MRRITNYIVKFRYIFLVVFTFFACISLYLQTKVKINDDIMKYLPKTSETKIGNDIMSKEFSKLTISELNVMFKNLSKKEESNTLEKLSKVKDVSSVKNIGSKEYKGNKYTLYKVTVDDSSDSKKASNVYNRINDNFEVDAYSGSIYDENKPLLSLWIVILSISCALVILIILSESWFEPFLYLISIGIAVFINKGTNIMFGSISSITNAIVAVLQLALSMDYSIMLSNRYKQEKENRENKSEAMKEALYQSFKAITSSSLTTIVGLLALVFMSFTIGRDLGFILAKGVMLSLICIFFCLPALLLLFDNFMNKTKKKSFKFKLDKLSFLSYKYKYIATILIVALFIIAFLVKGSVQILYTDIQDDKVGAVFGSNNQIAIVYENKYHDEVNDKLTEIKDDKKVTSVLSYDLLTSEKLSSKELLQVVSSISSSIDIDEELIRFVYYTYFDGKIHDNISINDLITTIKSNKLLNDFVSNNSNFDIAGLYRKLKGVNLDQKLNVKTLSNYLNIDEHELSLIYLFYNSSIHYNDEWKLTGEELFDFIKSVASEEEALINKYIPLEKRASLIIILNKVSDIKNIFVSDNYGRVVINSSYKLEGKDTYNFIRKIKNNIKNNEGIYVVGVSPMAYEMSNSFNKELNKITLITILFIFVVVAFTFKDFIIPFVLVLMIQCAVYITMSYVSLTGGSVYFIALLIVQAILMGATIDYAIVFTSYYREGRLTKNVKDAIKYAYNGSIKTIISSASILIIVTLIVSNFATAISAKICETVSQGTLCSLVLVLFILPGVLATSDKLICRGKKFKKDN